MIKEAAGEVIQLYEMVGKIYPSNVNDFAQIVFLSIRKFILNLKSIEYSDSALIFARQSIEDYIFIKYILLNRNEYIKKYNDHKIVSEYNSQNLKTKRNNYWSGN